MNFEYLIRAGLELFFFFSHNSPPITANVRKTQSKKIFLQSPKYDIENEMEVLLLAVLVVVKIRLVATQFNKIRAAHFV